MIQGLYIAKTKKDSDMYTRRDYLYKRCTHREYYSQFVTEEIRNYVQRRIGLNDILNSTDEWFNDIPLKRWDSIAYNLRVLVDDQLLTETQAGWCLATATCISKEAARQLKEVAYADTR